MPSIYKVIIFVIVTIGILWVSRSSLRDPQSHGFYRTFVFESILILSLLAVDAWFAEPFNPPQIISRVFLIISLVLIIQGFDCFVKRG
ncbi:MAG: methyltransferase family protein, partial [Bellilinea sp.]